MLERQRGGAYAVVRLTGRQQTVGVVMNMYNRIKGVRRPSLDRNLTEAAGDSAQKAARRRLPVSGRTSADLAPLRRIRRAPGSARA